LIPLRRRTFVPREEVLAAVATAPVLDAERCRADRDAWLIRTGSTVTGEIRTPGLVDTSVVIRLGALDPSTASWRRSTLAVLASAREAR
jgi:hypothetical protein